MIYIYIFFLCKYIANQTNVASLVPPRGTTHPPAQSHPMYSTGVPHALHGGFTFFLPSSFSLISPSQNNTTTSSSNNNNNNNNGHQLWEEIAVRPDVSEELSVHSVLPQDWKNSNGELNNINKYPQLTPLQTTGSGDCLLNALSLGMYGVQDRTRSLAIGDTVHIINDNDDNGIINNSNNNNMKYRIVEVTPDGSAVGVVPFSSEANSEPMIIPCSNIVGEADTDSVDYKLLQEGAFALSTPSSSASSSSSSSNGMNISSRNTCLSLASYSSGVILSREWASLRLLLSCCMRESGDVLFPRWARDRIANTNDETENVTCSKVKEIEKHGKEDNHKAEDEDNEMANKIDDEKFSTEDDEVSSGAHTIMNIKQAALEEGFITAQRLQDDWHESLDDAGTPKRSLLPEHVW